MNKPKHSIAWRIVGIVVTALLILGGFAGAYALGVNRGAAADLSDSGWVHPMDRFNDGEYNDYGYGRMPMYSGYRSFHNPLGGIFGFFLFVVVIGAFLRLVFFPFRMARHAMWAHRYHDCRPGCDCHHGAYRHEQCCCDDETPDSEEDPSAE